MSLIVPLLLVLCLFFGREPWVPAVIFVFGCIGMLRAGSIKPGPIHWLALACIAYIGLSLIPFPVVGSGSEFESYQQADAFIASVEQTLSPDAMSGTTDQAYFKAQPISQNTIGTTRSLLLLIGLFGLSQLLVSRGKQSLFLLVMLALVLSINVVAGLFSLTLYPQGKTILWLFEVVHGTPLGAFANKNHYAFACLLAMASTIPLIAIPLTRIRSGQKSSLNYLTMAVAGLILVLSIIGFLMSQSRGAFLAMTGSTCLVALLAGFRGHRVAVLLAGLLLLTVGSVIVLRPASPVAERMATLKSASETNSAQTRLQSWQDSVGIWRDYPLFGVGAEGFRSVYPQYKSLNSRKTFYYAENEYVQLLAEFGLVGLLLIGTLLFLIARWLYRTKEQRPDWKNLLILWLLAVAALHQMVDFPMRHPLNALSWLVLLIVLSECALKPSAFHLPPRQSAAGFILIFSLGLSALLLQPAAMRMRIEAESLNHTGLERSLIAIRSAPGNPLGWYFAANELNRMAATARPAARAFAIQDLALQGYEQATQLSPMNYAIWKGYAEAAKKAGDRERYEKARERAISLRPYLRL